MTKNTFGLIAIVLILLFLTIMSEPTAEAQVFARIEIRIGIVLPTLCRVGNVFFLTTGSIGLYQCIALNTWQNIVGAGGGLGDPGGNGVVIRTGLNTTTFRTITGTANKVAVTNGSGVSGDPTLNVGSDITQINQANTYSGGGLQDFSAMKLKLGATTVASLPAAASNTNVTYLITDGNAAGDCTTGGGSTRVLCTSNGTIWFATGDGGGNHNFLSATHSDTTASAAVRGGLPVAIGASPLWTQLAKGTQYQSLQGGVSDLLWDALHLDQSTATTGNLPANRGGTGLDTSATTGIVRINAGTWSANAGISHLAASTSADLAVILTDESGTDKVAFTNSPVFVTPTLGAATATSINSLTITTSTGTLTITNAKTLAATASLTLAGVDGKTVTFNNSITFVGTDGTTMTFPSVSSTLVANTRAINTTSPLSGGGDLSADRTITIANAVADGATKGAASFTAADFDATTGNISLDYTNGQKATTSIPGFLSSADWTTFNNKVATSRAINTTSPITGGGDLSADRTFACATCTTDTNTQTVTGKTIDAEGTGNVITIPALFVYKAAVCQNTTASLGFSTPTTNPAVAACVTGTNTQYGVAQFADGANSLSVQDHFTLPGDFTGNIDVDGYWRTSATTGNVVWQVSTICVADAETGDPAFNTASTVTETAKGTTLQFNSFSMTSITITGCAANEEMFFKFFRDPANASDTLAATADLIALRFKVRRAM